LGYFKIEKYVIITYRDFGATLFSHAATSG